MYQKDKEFLILSVDDFTHFRDYSNIHQTRIMNFHRKSGETSGKVELW